MGGTMTKILLVEDDKSLREIYGVRLLAEGYDIVSAGDGEEALAMAIKDRPGLIISDVMMPKISGFDMLDILRSTTETKDIKVIMMTALSSEDQRARGEQLGADRYLVKSQVGIEDVVRTVHEVLADAPTRPAATFASAPAAGMPAASSAISNRPVSSGTAMPQSVPTPGVAPSMPAPAVAPTPQPVAPIASPLAPATPPQAPSPSSTFQPAPAAAPAADLPRPTAPFSTPRPAGLGLSDRVINPLPKEETSGPDINELMDKELSNTNPTVPAFALPTTPPQLSSSPVSIPTPPAPQSPLAAAPVNPPTPAAPTLSTPVAPTPPPPPSNPFVAPASNVSMPSNTPSSPETSGLDFEETPRSSDSSTAL